MDFICKICNKHYKHKKSLKRHIKEAHFFNSNFECNFCLISFKRKEYYLRHFKTVHFNLKLECNFCLKNFYSEFILDKHIEEKHNFKKCFNCLSYFKDLNNHKNCISNNRIFECPNCNKKYWRHTNYLKHLIETHKIIDDKELKSMILKFYNTDSKDLMYKDNFEKYNEFNLELAISYIKNYN